MKRKLIALLAGLAITLAAVAAPLATVVVTGERIGGGTIVCRGQDCANVLRSLQNPVNEYQQYALVEDIGVDSIQFCRTLRNAKPANCDLSKPPASPGLTATWRPNGCGTGRFSNQFLSAALNGLSHAYSSDLDAPYAGVSFLSACNRHDECYASAVAKDKCDADFGTAMRSACDAAGAAQACRGFAGLYEGVVSTFNAGDSAYSKSVAERKCALWASDMKENQCG